MDKVLHQQLIQNTEELRSLLSTASTESVVGIVLPGTKWQKNKVSIEPTE